MNDPSKLDLRWIRGKTRDWTATIAEIEKIAAEIMVEEDIGEWDFCFDLIQSAGKRPHAGDCGLCRSWLTAPITCDACVYDEYMLKAWAKKREAIEAAASLKGD
jgi:hypothetical protein